MSGWSFGKIYHNQGWKHKLTMRDTRLADYRPPAYVTRSVEMTVRLDEHATEVITDLAIERVDSTLPGEPLELFGENLKTHGFWIDGEPVADGQLNFDGSKLYVLEPKDRFVMRTHVAIDPADNTRLEGLYLSRNVFCTQCEAEGFRRITWSQDRPDVLARYRTRIEAHAEQAPVLLSNGNCVEKGVLDHYRHFAIYEDPWPKPSYLFALVGGELDVVSDRFTFQSGKQVTINIYVEPGSRSEATYALTCVKEAMAWEAERWGLEYDLDTFNIVAIRDFNFGAMENKGLNVFNAAYVLANSDIATDQDYADIQAVIGHEYFHNWTGNRVTCRNWFQLSLKEGLTVFRDQEFSSDMRNRSVKRIEDIGNLRSRQFAEDAGAIGTSGPSVTLFRN